MNEELKDTFSSDLLMNTHFESRNLKDLEIIPVANLEHTQKRSNLHCVETSTELEITPVINLDNVQKRYKDIHLNIEDNIRNRSLIEHIPFLPNISHDTMVNLVQERSNKKTSQTNKNSLFEKDARLPSLIKTLRQIELDFREGIPSVDLYYSNVKEYYDIIPTKEKLEEMLKLCQIRFKKSEEVVNTTDSKENNFTAPVHASDEDTVSVDFNEINFIEDEQTPTEEPKFNGKHKEVEINHTDNLNIEEVFAEAGPISLYIKDQTETIDPSIANLLKNIYFPFRTVGKVPSLNYYYAKVKEVSKTDISKEILMQWLLMLDLNFSIDEETIEQLRKDEISPSDPLDCTSDPSPVNKLLNYNQTSKMNTKESRLNTKIVQVITDLEYKFHSKKRIPTLDTYYEQFLDRGVGTCSISVLKQWLDKLNIKYRLSDHFEDKKKEKKTVKKPVPAIKNTIKVPVKTIPKLKYFSDKFVRELGTTYSNRVIRYWLQQLNLKFEDNEADQSETEIDNTPIDSSIIPHLKRFNNEYYQPPETNHLQKDQLHPEVVENIKDVINNYVPLGKLPVLDLVYDKISYDLTKNELERYLRKMKIKFHSKNENKRSLQVPETFVRNNDPYVHNIPSLGYFYEGLKQNMAIDCSKDLLQRWLTLMYIPYRSLDEEYWFGEDNINLDPRITNLVIKLHEAYFFKVSNIQSAEREKFQKDIVSREKNLQQNVYSSYCKCTKNKKECEYFVPKLNYFHQGLTEKMGVTCSKTSLKRWLNIMVIPYCLIDEHEIPDTIIQYDVELSTGIITFLLRLNREFESFPCTAVVDILRDVENKFKEKNEIPSLSFINYYLQSFKVLNHENMPNYSKDTLRHWLGVLKIKYITDDLKNRFNADNVRPISTIKEEPRTSQPLICNEPINPGVLIAEVPTIKSEPEQYVENFNNTADTNLIKPINLLNAPHGGMKLIKLTDLPRIELPKNVPQSELLTLNIHPEHPGVVGQVFDANHITLSDVRSANDSFPQIVISDVRSEHPDVVNLESGTTNVGRSPIMQLKKWYDNKFEGMTEGSDPRSIHFIRSIKEIEQELVAKDVIPSLDYIYARLNSMKYLIDKASLKMELNRLGVHFIENVPMDDIRLTAVYQTKEGVVEETMDFEDKLEAFVVKSKANDNVSENTSEQPIMPISFMKIEENFVDDLSTNETYKEIKEECKDLPDLTEDENKELIQTPEKISDSDAVDQRVLSILKKYLEAKGPSPTPTNPDVIEINDDQIEEETPKKRLKQMSKRKLKKNIKNPKRMTKLLKNQKRQPRRIRPRSIRPRPIKMKEINDVIEIDDEQTTQETNIVQNSIPEVIEIIDDDEDESNMTPSIQNHRDNEIPLKRKFQQSKITNKRGRLSKTQIILNIFVDVEYTFYQKGLVPTLEDFYEPVALAYPGQFSKSEIGEWLSKIGIRVNYDNRFR